ncbi:MAG: hypothetical protein HYZ53_08320 [Planctomycetes bacterium]|nr:hypothetical protein [Planctomycetota bacterium]
MPCDIGFRSVAKARVAKPAPRSFESRTSAPKIDADLLERLGREDAVFLGWINDLDTDPLLAKALERALAALGPAAAGAEFAVRGGELAARARFRNAAEKAAGEETVARVAARWQMEVLRVVAELLDYEVTIAGARVDGGEVVVLEGEKAGKGKVREYLRIEVDATGGGAELRFEHFASEEASSAEEARFLALAQRLGVRIAVKSIRRAGKPIAKKAVHRHPPARGGGR